MTYNIKSVIPQQVKLDGKWDFTYDNSQLSDIPSADKFTIKMPVPGYWDDNIHRMQDSHFWSTAKFNPDFRHIDYPMGENPPDASLPYLLGVGWYKKIINVPLELKSEQVYLSIGGVTLEASIYINGNHARYHVGHSTAFEINITSLINFGEENEIIIAVSNTRTDRRSCAIRGFKGYSAGIKRSVYLKIAGELSIKECFLYPVSGLKEINWMVELEGKASQEVILSWLIRDPITNKVICKGTKPVRENSMRWSIDSKGIQPWSDKSPKLYEAEINLKQGENILDTRVQSFGLRLLERDECALRLNGSPVFLRGTTEHAYFPLTCTPPGDMETYRKNIKKLKELGFNWLRFHTWVPSEEYMQAADQLGMLIQVEPPRGFEKQEWLDILYACRNHPSVVIYCCGNEELLNEEKVEFLKEMAMLLKNYVPDALFNPHEGLRGIEYHFDETSEEETLAMIKNVEEPFQHNPERLNSLREFSDVFGQYPLGLLSYFSIQGDMQTLDNYLKIYQRPCLSHEIGLHGNYLNLDLEHRYEGTRIGAEIYAAVRRNLKKVGLIQRAPIYYKNSCAWMKILRKHSFEMARKCKYYSGYDFLGAIDYHWHRSGYPCGIMNEFYEMKPGESPDDVLEYNGESVLLLDHTNKRNLKCGDTISLDLYTSLYGKHNIEEGHLYWYWKDDGSDILQKGSMEVTNIPNGSVEKLNCIIFQAPKLNNPTKATLHVRLSGGEYEIRNHWDFWIFPDLKLLSSNVVMDEMIAKNYKNTIIESKITSIENADIQVVSELTEDTLNYLIEGGRVVLIGSKPFPTQSMSFQLSHVGRPRGNLATVIEEHTIMNHFPHNGFCDWQFFDMIEEGDAVVFDHLKTPFSPIIEVVSSFKSIRKQASLFEIRVGKGNLLVCTLKMDEANPAANYLLKLIINYAVGKNFKPVSSMSVDEIKWLMGANINSNFEYITDEALDYNVM